MEGPTAKVARFDQEMVDDDYFDLELSQADLEAIDQPLTCEEILNGAKVRQVQSLRQGALFNVDGMATSDVQDDLAPIFPNRLVEQPDIRQELEDTKKELRLLRGQRTVLQNRLQDKDAEVQAVNRKWQLVEADRCRLRRETDRLISNVEDKTKTHMKFREHEFEMEKRRFLEINNSSHREVLNATQTRPIENGHLRMIKISNVNDSQNYSFGPNEQSFRESPPEKMHTIKRLEQFQQDFDRTEQQNDRNKHETDQSRQKIIQKQRPCAITEHLMDVELDILVHLNGENCGEPEQVTELLERMLGSSVKELFFE